MVSITLRQTKFSQRFRQKFKSLEYPKLLVVFYQLQVTKFPLQHNCQQNSSKGQFAIAFGYPYFNYIQLCQYYIGAKQLLLQNNLIVFITVFGPIPLNCESSALTSSTENSRRYSKHNFPLFLNRQFKILLIQEALVGARPPHLIAFSI